MATTSFKKNFVISNKSVSTFEKVLAKDSSKDIDKSDIRNVKMDKRRMDNIFDNFSKSNQEND